MALCRMHLESQNQSKYVMFVYRGTVQDKANAYTLNRHRKFL